MTWLTQFISVISNVSKIGQVKFYSTHSSPSLLSETDLQSSNDSLIFKIKYKYSRMSISTCLCWEEHTVFDTVRCRCKLCSQLYTLLLTDVAQPDFCLKPVHKWGHYQHTSGTLHLVDNFLVSRFCEDCIALVSRLNLMVYLDVYHKS